MKHNNPPQFYLTIEQDCPYIEGQRERKVFTNLSEPNSQLVQNALSEIGFRRSQNIIYRPVCTNCSRCMSVRIVASEFAFSKNQNRVLNKNKDLVREVRKCEATEEQYELFRRYLNARHVDGGMADMGLKDYSDMINEVTISSRLIEYRQLDGSGRPDRLVACTLTDIIENGISMVYSFFEPEFAARSLGTFVILDHVRLCKEAKMDYTYLGYWVKGAPTMDYKRRFSPLEVFHDGKWRRNANLDELISRPQNAQTLLLQAHRKLFETRKF